MNFVFEFDGYSITTTKLVIPANAGIQEYNEYNLGELDPRVRGNESSEKTVH